MDKATPSAGVFSKCTYRRPQASHMQDLLNRTKLTVRLSLSVQPFVKALKELEAALLELEQARRLACLRAELGPEREYYRRERDWYPSLYADLQSPLNELASLLVNHRLENQAIPLIGQEVFRLARRQQEQTSPMIEEEARREEVLVQELSERRGDPSAPFLGPTRRTTVWDEGEGFFDETQRALRENAEIALFGQNLQRKEELLDELLQLRQRMAERLGYRNFLELGRLLYRVDDDLVRGKPVFRRLVKRYLVPLCEEIRRLQARRLGLERLGTGDLRRLILEAWPDEAVAHSAMEEAYAETLQELLDPEATLFHNLIAEGHVCLDEALARRLDGLEKTLMAPARPFLAVGRDDVSSFLPRLFYASGVALAERALYEHERPLFCWQPAPLLLAVSGQALSWRSALHWEKFLGRAAGLALELDVTRRLLELPLMCALDEFEEQLYLAPRLTALERNQVWRRLERVYLPSEARAHQEGPYPYGSAWLAVVPLMTAPFSALDQALADVSVLADRPFRPHASELERHQRRLLSRLAGAAPLQLLTDAGFRDPFSETTLRRASYAAASVLGL